MKDTVYIHVHAIAAKNGQGDDDHSQAFATLCSLHRPMAEALAQHPPGTMAETGTAFFWLVPVQISGQVTFRLITTMYNEAYHREFDSMELDMIEGQDTESLLEFAEEIQSFLAAPKFFQMENGEITIPKWIHSLSDRGTFPVAAHKEFASI